MQTILYVSLTANGRLGQSGGGHASPPQIQADFAALARRSGNVIIGRRTYELLGSQAAFTQALAGVTIIVVSGRAQAPGDVTMASSPQEALRALGDRGFAAPVVGGGAQLDGAFLSEGLADELYVNIMPSITGSGPVLPVADTTEATLRLIDTKRLAGGLLQLHYAIQPREGKRGQQGAGNV